MTALYIVSCVFDAFVIYLLFEDIFGKRKSSVKRTPPSFSKVPIILLMRKSAMKCGRWRMRYRLTSPIRGSGCVFAPWERLCAVAA